jgi:hypothetical protein
VYHSRIKLEEFNLRTAINYSILAGIGTTNTGPTAIPGHVDSHYRLDFVHPTYDFFVVRVRHW